MSQLLVPIVRGNLLSTKVKWAVDGYDAFFSSKQAIKENAEIRFLIRSHFGYVSKIIDLGCGTGLGQDLIPYGIEYIGVDVDADMVEHCRACRPGRFFRLDALAAIDSFEGPKMALFSLTDFSYRAIFKFSQEKKALAIAYDRPYLEGSASAFLKKKYCFTWKYGVKTIVTKILLRMAGFKLSNFLGEPYYFVAAK